MEGVGGVFSDLIRLWKCVENENDWASMSRKPEIVLSRGRLRQANSESFVLDAADLDDGVSLRLVQLD